MRCVRCDAMRCNAMRCVLATLTSSHTVSLLLFSVRTTDSPNWTESFVLFFCRSLGCTHSIIPSSSQYSTGGKYSPSSPSKGGRYSSATTGVSTEDISGVEWRCRGCFSNSPFKVKKLFRWFEKRTESNITQSHTEKFKNKYWSFLKVFLQKKFFTEAQLTESEIITFR